MNYDFGLTATDYATHRAGFPPDLFARLQPYGIGLKGQRLLDLATGTGTLARGFALRGCRVSGLDIAAPMMAQARELDQRAGVVVDYHLGRAEATGLPEGSFDVVSAGQCWHWFDAQQATQEIRRLLRPSGAVLIASFDWLPRPGNLVAAMEALVKQHNPAWDKDGGCGIHPDRLNDLLDAGFVGLESFSFDLDVPYTPEAWRGRIRASAGVGASLPPDAVARFDEAHSQLLQTRFPQDMLQVPHRVFAVIARKLAAT
ncbi:class I SAM-dependent methyltransferase [Leeia sp.]|uniref:class I SAM-dependent methyltransferase n=1 Tax=Leeia sp. TaxID=2884678 RepID=UPI0035B10438